MTRRMIKLPALRTSAVLVGACAALAVAAPAFAAAPSGKDLFEDQCAMCHTVKATDTTGAAPPLGGVVGRKVASAPKWKFSPALTKLGGKWDAARVNTFLTNPQKLAPGTTMYFNVEAPAERTAIIKYLGTLKP